MAAAVACVVGLFNLILCIGYGLAESSVTMILV